MKRLEVSNYQDLLQIRKKCLLLSHTQKKKWTRSNFISLFFLLLPFCSHLPLIYFHVCLLLHLPFFCFCCPFHFQSCDIFHKLLFPISHPCTALDNLFLPLDLHSPLISFCGSECRAMKMSNVIKIIVYIKISTYRVLSTLPDPAKDAYLVLCLPVHICRKYLRKMPK